MRRLRGVKGLVHDAIDRVSDLVAIGHESTARNVMRVTDRVPGVAGPARAVDSIRHAGTRGVIGTIKRVNRVIESLSDMGLDLAAGEPSLTTSIPAVPMRSDAIDSASWMGDAAVGLVNAVIGDHLHVRHNGLDMGVVLRVGDRYVPPDADAIRDAAGERTLHDQLAIFVHGLGTTEWSWCLEALAYHGDASATFGSLLERDCGYTPVFVRYNTGRHVSESGRALARELERFVDAYERARGGPIARVALIGHSMGGLVLRSACHYAVESSARWPSLVEHVVCLGTPHRGAPLEKLGNVVTGVLGAIDLPGTLIVARLLESRSVGIKDLRHGSVLDEDWIDAHPDALWRDREIGEAELLPHARYTFVGATITSDPEHPLGRIVGDVLVRMPSSSGPHITRRPLAIDTHRFGGVLHHQLQSHPAIYEVVRDAVRAR